MDFKFIVLALIISLAAGEAAKKTESPVIGSSDKTVESSKNEELSSVKDYVTSAKSEKLMHDEKNIAEGKPEGLPHKASIHVNSSADAAVADNGTVPNPPPAPSTDPTSKPTTTTTTKPITTTTTTTTKSTTTMNTEPTTTTTPKPTIASVPEKGNWTFNDSNTVCIVMQMEIEFNITYPGNKNNMYNKTIFMPKNANATGHCGNKSENITLEWDSGNTFRISFTSNETVGKFYISSFNLTVNTTGFENIKDKVTNLTYVSTKSDFPVVPLKMSYRCEKQLKQTLQSSEKYNATLLVSHTQFQAFMANKTVFGEVKDCDEFDTPDIVPIAVGCVLSILVLIVLVAYLIGRRRSQSRGYLSMATRFSNISTCVSDEKKYPTFLPGDPVRDYEMDDSEWVDDAE